MGRRKGINRTRNDEFEPNVVLWGTAGSVVRIALRCGACGGLGKDNSVSEEGEDDDALGETEWMGDQVRPCAACEGCGWLGIRPELPSDAEPGSFEKLLILQTRYAQGAPLIIDGDRAKRIDPLETEGLERYAPRPDEAYHFEPPTNQDASWHKELMCL